MVPVLLKAHPVTDISIDMKEQLARIDRTQAETGKLIEETQKYMAEQHKLLAKQHKLLEEADKLRRDHGFAPYALALGAVGGTAGLVVAISAALKNLGIL